MQQPWNNFATNYSERGSNFPGQASMYPTSPSQPQPSFNRSPAPFTPQYQPAEPAPVPMDYNQVPLQNMQNGSYSPQVQPEHYPQPQQYGYPLVQSYPQVDQSGYPVVDPGYPSNQFQRQQKNTREDPDIDEDFPSFKDIKGMFLKKQKQAEREERRTQTLPGRGRRLSGPASPSKPNMHQPEYLKSSMPIHQPYTNQNPQSAQQQQTYQPPQQTYQPPLQNYPTQQAAHPTSKGKLSLKMPGSPMSPPKPRRSFSQVSQSPVSPQPPLTQKPPIFRQISSGSGSAKLNMTTPPAKQSATYEIPVTHVSPPKPQRAPQDWHHVKPSREQIRYRPPMSIQVPSYQQQAPDSGDSPRVVITSNSPRSPQKAFYVGEGEGGAGPSWPPARRASIAVASPVRQRQTGGWSVNIPVHHYSPQVKQTAGNQGKTAAHLQYNSPMSLYSTKNAQQALDKDKEASELIKIVGEDGKSTNIINSPTLQAVLREDSVRKQTGHKPNVAFYHTEHEYGPGIGPLRQYEETPDTLEQCITSYNKTQDKSLSYPMWMEL